MKKFYLLFSFVFCIAIHINAQQAGKLIDVDYKQANIDQVTADLKAKTGYQIYYDRLQFDSLKVTLVARQQTVAFVLGKIFENTAYHFLITPDREIILTKNQQIDTDLAQNITNSSIATVITDHPVSNHNVTAPSEQIINAVSENKLYEIGSRTNNIKAGTASLSGYVHNAKTGQPISGASIINIDTRAGIATDSKGYFSLNLPKGRQVLVIKGLGMKDTRRQIVLYSSGRLNIELQEKENTLKEVQISGEKVRNVQSTEMGSDKLDIKNIKQVPTAFGEADVMQVVLTLPGVQTVGEATTGFNVRGGSADQNLILLNDATIYNPSHFFGFFSSFNSDVVKEVELYKSTIPERFGGRLSSVLEVIEREGNKQKFTGSAGIGLLTSRINVEGPIVKDRTSFIFGARTTYSDWLLKLLPDAYKNSSASFYDINLNISHKIDDKNNLYLTVYTSHDKFRLNSDTTYSYGNRNDNLKWKHDFSTKFNGAFLAGFDNYQYDISSSANPVNAYKLNFSVKQTSIRGDFNYYIDRRNTLNFGINSIYYKLNPGNDQPLGSASLLVPETIPGEQALESALYLGDKFDVMPDLSLSAGIRYSIYNYLGAQTVDSYVPGLPRTAATVTDSITYGSNKVIHTYHGPEVRVSARYNIGDNTSVKASYNTLKQYIHLLSNTTAISPTDIYKLSDPNIKPQFGEQVSLGLYHNLQQNTIETSVEVYYKKIYDYLDYKSGATLLLNKHIEREVVSTEGKAYGVEFLIRKNSGNLNGWISYTYSRTLLRQDDPQGGPLINNGAYYPANYDKPHAFNFIGNYRVSRRFSMSLNVIYSTGRPITYPITEFYLAGQVHVLYSDRNEFRIPDYFRSDFALNIDGNHKVHQRFHNSFTIGVYNWTGRANAYSAFFQQQGGSINSYTLSIFSRPIPFINYNIRF